ncbi:MAG: TonB-dependent vitamin B12 receptor [SAR86 cluster bacterium]|uniref:TonB-dependent vitamin B12 receptor n=1 Tax=SAR86 cluster bacterium TaxID=2030880 RepID=A0A2A4MI25_9GAMM|nr:MAG: TonB-dependent vitamin B12 receptor [SAR86 cluster bacterium]
MKKIALLSAAIAASSLPVLAAENSSNTIGEIVVTASRIAQPLHKVLASVSVLTREDIEKATATSLPDLLGSLPGIDYATSGGRGSSSSLYMRGTNSDHVLILINGVRTASATNGTTALQQIPLSQIERIEVVRGPRSSLYGAEAIGGVIQIFTRDVQRSNLAVEFGSFNTKKAQFSQGAKIGSTDISLNIGYEDSAGFDNTITSGSVDDDKDSYNEFSLSAGLTHTFDNSWELALNVTRVDAENEFDSGADDYTDTINQAVTARLQAPLTDYLQLTLAAGQYLDESDNFGSYVSFFDTQRDSLSAQADIKLAEESLLSIGYDYYEDQVAASDNFTVNSRDNKAFFAQYQGELDKFSISASVRRDDNEAFGAKTTQSAAFGYELGEQTLVSLSYGTAFKAPTFNDLYFPFVDYGFGYSFVGNPDLQAEESDSYELLLRSQWQGVAWDFSYYQTDVENLIEYNGGPAGLMENISNVEITGAELGASFDLFNWNVQSSLSYTDPRDTSDSSLIDNRARAKVGVVLNRTFSGVDIGVNFKSQSYRYSRGEKLAGYSTVDVSANYTLASDIVLSAKVNNIFDKDYVINTGSRVEYRTPGVNFMLGASLAF